MGKCSAVLFHGPGHQSRTYCQVKGKHHIHKAIYGSLNNEATWIGSEAITGFFDEPPNADHILKSLAKKEVEEE